MTVECYRKSLSKERERERAVDPPLLHHITAIFLFGLFSCLKAVSSDIPSCETDTVVAPWSLVEPSFSRQKRTSQTEEGTQTQKPLPRPQDTVVCPEDGDSWFLRNVGNLLPFCTS
jgi:hypothetical protein